MKSVQIRKRKSENMLRRSLNILTSRIYYHSIFFIRQSSLFINGSKASEIFVYVTPHIDVPKYLKQKEAIQEQLIKRNVNFDLKKLEELWAVYEEIRQCKIDMDNKKSEISKELSKLIKSDPDSDVIRKFKIQMDVVKDNIKTLKVPLWSAEEAVMVEALKLPNVLHPDTPVGENKILYVHLIPPNNNKDHLQVGKKLNLVHFKKNENYYLKGEAAVFELGAKFYFSDILKKNNCIQFSNPDFVKSVIVEGCGGDHTDPNSTFILHHTEDLKVNVDNRLHLTGGGSLYSFFAYHAKNIVYAKVLPLKYFSLGRQYVPPPSDEDSLFHVSQSSVVQLFAVTKDENHVATILKELIEILKLSYSQLGYHFRLCILSADKLLLWESMRLVVEMYSTSLNSYVEVANVSVSGDFISKRLMFTYIDNKKSKFPQIISGTILNVPKLLACVLEQDADFSLPEQFKVENWKM